MSWYASCESGHLYWSGPDENTSAEARVDANQHDQNVHGGVATAVVLETRSRDERHLVNLKGEWHEVEKSEARPVALAVVNDCQGNACGDVSITFNYPGYDFTNHGGRRVRVVIRFAIGLGDCMGPANIDLDPGQTRHFDNGGYCHPWSANYI